MKRGFNIPKTREELDEGIIHADKGICYEEMLGQISMGMPKAFVAILFNAYNTPYTSPCRKYFAKLYQIL